MEKSAPASETVCEVLRGLFRSPGAVSIRWNPYFFRNRILSKIPFAWYLYPQIWLSGAKVNKFSGCLWAGKGSEGQFGETLLQLYCPFVLLSVRPG